MSVQSYRDLEVWKKSITLVKHTYEVTANFPSEEKYGLVSQMRRSAVSVPSNIAEGRSRSSTKEFIRFLDIAHGSLSELETQYIIACELQFLSQEMLRVALEQASAIGKMLNGLMKTLYSRLAPKELSLNPEP